MKTILLLLVLKKLKKRNNRELKGENLTNRLKINKSNVIML